MAFYQQKDDELGAQRLGGAGECKVKMRTVLAGRGECCCCRHEIVLMIADSAVESFYQGYDLAVSLVSEGQLSALLALLKQDPVLREKLKAVGSLDDAVALAKEAGFDVSKTDWLNHQARQVSEVNDADLESFAGGRGSNKPSCQNCTGTEVICLYCQ